MTTCQGLMLAEGQGVPAPVHIIYVTDAVAFEVSKILSDGSSTTQAWASLGAVGPYFINTDASGNVYTLNTNAGTISKITPAGVVTATWATITANDSFIVKDGSGNFYTLLNNATNSVVTKITPAGSVNTGW